jgi:hypothetical protein
MNSPVLIYFEETGCYVFDLFYMLQQPGPVPLAHTWTHDTKSVERCNILTLSLYNIFVEYWTFLTLYWYCIHAGLIEAFTMGGKAYEDILTGLNFRCIYILFKDY